MPDVPLSESTDAEQPRKRPFQFGVRHLLIAMAAVAALFSLAHYIGACGLVAFGLLAILGLWTVWEHRQQHFGPAHLLDCIAVFFILIALFLPAVTTSRAPPRAVCCNNLRQILLALHNYHDAYGCFPPAYVADKNGRPMHSWRTLILPYLDRSDIYKQYRFDESWDGPNNSRLTGSIKLNSFRCAQDRESPPTHTNSLAVIGPETAWPGSRCVRIEDFRKGTCNTILLVEVRHSGIAWMEPRDLDMRQMAPGINAKAVQGISSNHPAGANVGFADGSVRFLPDSLTPAELDAMLSIRGGETAPEIAAPTPTATSEEQR